MFIKKLTHADDLNATQARISLWGVSWMSFFLSCSSLMVFALLPTFLTEVLGASYTKVGVIEGVAIFLAFVAKVFSGVISDIFRTRRPLIAVGSLFTILVKLMFAAATSIGWIFIARSVDRLGKGIRSSPTDALIADLAHEADRGKSYGLRQTLYTLGALVGSASATIAMLASNNNYRLVFFIAALPACLALVLLFTVIKQPKIKKELSKPNLGWQIRDIRYLPKSFWLLLGVTFILMLGRFSEAFISLHAKALGWEKAYLPVLLIGMELMHAAVAYPIGRIADKSNRQELFLKGILMLVLTNFIFITNQSLIGVTLGALGAGLHMGMTQGLLSTLVAESTPAELRGTAFALFYLTAGTAVLIGNTIAGVTNDSIGTTGAFYFGLIVTTLAACFLYVLLRKQKFTLADPEAA